ncbi:hypothetical protein AVEN_206924-1 [Araneus ventricosus]|uniref:Uncharacterized protein n=1 Tax=Araneus ventricosus TaxID=182803 RepID=A0A4Y2IYN0_ARAVE|nr:hypothetical protein AVEN_206924-1 [Araneus ventricosus]
MSATLLFPDLKAPTPSSISMESNKCRTSVSSSVNSVKYSDYKCGKILLTLGTLERVKEMWSGSRVWFLTSRDDLIFELFHQLGADSHLNTISNVS